jgi:hypothetical protein
MLPGIYEQISFAKREAVIPRPLLFMEKRGDPPPKITITMRTTHKINETNTFSGNFMYNIVEIPC